MSIIEAAQKIFSAHGFSGASIAGIARCAGIPKANVHYYFSTKEILYQEVLRRTMHAWLGEAETWLTMTASAPDALRGYIRAKLDFSRNNAEASRLVAHEIISGGKYISQYLTSVLREEIRPIVTALRYWMARDELPRTDPVHFLFCLWAMTQWYADMRVQVVALLDKTELDQQDFDDAAETILALVLKQPGLARLEQEPRFLHDIQYRKKAVSPVGDANRLTRQENG
ncbi:TetR/AcrR family transcriptional regulator [Swaminathania salitolerans]|uniref:TetR/AcrR family transcriptional regulator n=1 Tax=Swaminathania salitolerans TaxID=182838 RepID=UPI00164981DD|nr:TetR/AcrR family transcriptional regulator [Swaminathania salitolerans]